MNKNTKPSRVYHSEEGCFGHYVTIKDGNNRVVARIPSNQPDMQFIVGAIIKGAKILSDNK